MSELTLIIPDSVDRERSVLDFQPYDLVVYVPLPNTKDELVYVDRTGFANLLRANKNNPDAIQYLADILE